MSDYTVFVSYKSSDWLIADIMERELSTYAPDLKFFVAPTQVTEGEDWRDRLVREIRDSDMLFILYTPAFEQDRQETRTNDWLLYEAGLKSTLDTEPDPVICFYPQGQSVPKPVEHLQGVEAGRDSLRRFLDRFLRTTEITQRERPLNENLGDDRLDEIADALSAAFRVASTRRRYLTYRLSVTFPEPLALAGDSGDAEIPGEAVVDGDTASLDIFDRADPCTWEEFTRRRSSDDGPWLADLNAAFNAVVHGERLPPSTGTFRDPRGRILKPMVYRADLSDDKLVGVRVLLTVEPAPTYIGGELFNSLRLTERYKAEIFGEFLDDRLERARRNPELMAVVREGLTAALRLVDINDRTRWPLSRDTVIRHFPDDGDRAHLLRLREEWQALYNQLWQQLNEADQADEAATGERLSNTLAELRSNNDKTAAILAHRYLEILEATTTVGG